MNFQNNFKFFIDNLKCAQNLASTKICLFELNQNFSL